MSVLQEGVQACTLFLGWLGGGIVHANGPLVLTDGEQLPLGEADKGNLQRLERRRRAAPPGRHVSAQGMRRQRLFTLHHPGKAVSSEAQIPAPAPPTAPLAEPRPARGALGRGWGPVPGWGPRPKSSGANAFPERQEWLPGSQLTARRPLRGARHLPRTLIPRVHPISSPSSGHPHLGAQKRGVSPASRPIPQSSHPFSLTHAHTDQPSEGAVLTLLGRKVLWQLLFVFVYRGKKQVYKHLLLVT